MDSRMGIGYEEILKLLTEKFLAFPQSIIVHEYQEGNLTKIVVECDRADISRLIGTGAVMVRAIRTILTRIGDLNGEKIWFRIIEPKEGSVKHGDPFKPKDDWMDKDDEAVADIMDQAGKALFQGEFCVHVRSDGDVTKLYIHLQRECPFETIAALQVIFKAIGKGMGRKAIIVNATCSSKNT